MPIRSRQFADQRSQLMVERDFERRLGLLLAKADRIVSDHTPSHPAHIADALAGVECQCDGVTE